MTGHRRRIRYFWVTIWRRRLSRGGLDNDSVRGAETIGGRRPLEPVGDGAGGKSAWAFRRWKPPAAPLHRQGSSIASRRLQKTRPPLTAETSARPLAGIRGRRCLPACNSTGQPQDEPPGRASIGVHTPEHSAGWVIA